MKQIEAIIVILIPGAMTPITMIIPAGGQTAIVTHTIDQSVFDKEIIESISRITHVCVYLNILRRLRQNRNSLFVMFKKLKATHKTSEVCVDMWIAFKRLKQNRNELLCIVPYLYLRVSSNSLYIYIYIYIGDCSQATSHHQ